MDFIHDRFKYTDKQLPPERIDDRKPFTTDVDITDQFDYSQIEQALLSQKECDQLRLAAQFSRQKYTQLLISELGSRIEQKYGNKPKFHDLKCVTEPTRSGCTRSAFVLSIDTNRCSAFLYDLFDGCVVLYCAD
uniref:Uncharacterized protein n=1 Tax=Acrobeloides nanus TaxID=290746 RepID=A0A914CUX7_9BILA